MTGPHNHTHFLTHRELSVLLDDLSKRSTRRANTLASDPSAFGDLSKGSAPPEDSLILVHDSVRKFSGELRNTSKDFE